MDDGRLDFVEILEGVYHLHDDTARLPLRYGLVLLQVEVEVVSVAVLEYCAEGVGVDLEDVVEPDHSWMVQLLVNVVLSERVLYVVGLLVVLPVLVQLVDLARHVPLLLQVERLVHLAEAT